MKISRIQNCTPCGMLLLAFITVGSGSARAAIWTWASNVSGNWSDAANWVGGPINSVPDGAGSTASLTFNISLSAKTVTLDASRTVGILNIGDSGAAYNSYTLAASGGASLILDNGLVNAQINKTTALGTAADTISAPLLLNSNLDIRDYASASLLITGGLSANSAGIKALTNLGTGTNTVQLSGILGDGSGQIAVTQNSATSTLILAGANTYSGGTTVSAGTLQLGNGGTSGSLSLASAIVNHGTLVFNRSDTLTQGIDFSSVIAGTGSITQAGIGTTILSGTNTFSGVTTLTAGTLSVGMIGDGGTAGDLGAASSAAGNLVFNGGTLQYTGATASTNRSLTINAAKVATIDVTSGTSNLTLSGASTASTGALTKTGAGTLTLAGANNSTGLTTVAAGTLAYGVSDALGSGAVTVSGGTLSISSFSDTVGTVTLSSGTITGAGGVLTSTGTFEMQSGSLFAILAGTAALNKTTEGNITLAQMNLYTGLTTVSGGLLAYGINDALNTGAVTVNGGTLAISSFSDTVGAVTLSSGSITGTTGILTGTSYTLNGAGTISAILGGAGALTKTGAGTVSILGGSNTYSGATTITSGILNIQNNTALGDTTGSTSVASGAALQFQGDITVGAEALLLRGTGSSSDGALRNIGGINTYGGLVTLGAATRINSDADTLTLSNPGTITGATFGLTVGGAGSTLIDSIIGTTSGSLTKDGTGTLTLTGANTYTGVTTLSGGTLSLASIGNGGTANNLGAAAVAAANLVFNGGTLEYTGATASTNRSFTIIAGKVATLDVTSSTSNLTLSGTSTATTGALTKTGAGILTLSGANTFTGLTTVEAGTLAYGLANALGSGAVTVNGGVLDISSFNDSVGTVTLTSGSIIGAAGVLTGASYALDGTGTISAILGGTSVTLTKTNAGTVTLAKANTYGGLTSVNGGTLAYGIDNALGSGAVTVNGGTLDVSTFSDTVGAVTLTSGSITGTEGVLTGSSYTLNGTGAISAILGGSGVGLTKTNAGTMTLSASNTYTGLTTVSGGTLAYGIDNALGSGAVTVNGGILDISSFSDTVGALTLTSGSITGTTGVLTGTSYILNGAATVTTLSGSNTYTGITTLSSGTLAVSSIGNGGEAGNLGAAASAAANLVFDGGVLQYTDTTASTDRSFTINASKVATLDVSTDASNLTLTGASTATTGALTKTGVGTLTLGGSNSHTGLTTVSGGTLAYGVSNALSSGGVTVNSGTLDISTFSDTVGAVILTSGSITGTTGVLTGTSYTLNGTGTLSAILGGSATLTKSGTDTATLSGANAYTGATTLSAGTLKLGAAGTATNSPLGTTTAGTSVALGATLDLNGITLGTNEALTLNGTGVGGVGALINNSTTAATYGGLLTLGSNSRIGAGGDIVLSNTGTISGTYDFRLEGAATGSSLGSIIGIGTGALYKYGTGTWALSGASTYTGSTFIYEGTLKLSATGGGTNSPLGTTAGATGTQIGAALDLNGFTLGTAEPLTLRGTGVNSGGALTNSSLMAATYKGQITLGADASIVASKGDIILSYTAGNVLNTSYSLTLGGEATGSSIASVISSTTAGVTKEGAGKWALTGANTYTGVTTLTGGTLSVATIGNGGVAGNLGAAANTADRLIFNGGTLQYTGATASTNRSFTLTAATTGTIDVSANTLTISGAGTATSGGLTKTGSGMLILSGNNLHTGTTTVAAGTLSLGRATSTLADTSALTVSGGTLDVANSDTVGAVTLGGGAISGAGTLTGSSYALTNSGSISAILGGGGALTKSGAGTTTLSGSNTYTGSTTVNEGTLSIEASGMINSTSGISIGAGGFNYNSATALSQSVSFSGTDGTLSGTGMITPAVTVSAGNTLAPGNSIGTMSFGTYLTLAGISNFDVDPRVELGLGLNADRVSVTGAVTYGGALNVLYAGSNTDFTDGMVFKLFDAASYTGSFSAMNLPSLTGTGLRWQDQLGTNGSLVVIPEPGTVLLGSLGLLALLRRRSH